MESIHAINADLHCHSVVSDGTLTPEILAERARANGVALWSLTDHDEIGGQVRAQKAAQDLGMRYVTGVEVSVTWSGQTVHIVGLDFDPSHQGLIDGLYQTRFGRAKRARQISDQLAQAGIENAYEGALKFVGNPELISRTHFARFLVESGVCRSLDEVFARFLVAGKPGFVPHRWATLENAVTWITQAGGHAVIAHPGRYAFSSLQYHELYEEFKELGGVGIEVITGSHSPREYETFAKVAKDYGFMASRGSDFHGPQESSIDLGMLPNLPTQLRPVWSVFH